MNADRLHPLLCLSLLLACPACVEDEDEFEGGAWWVVEDEDCEDEDECEDDEGDDGEDDEDDEDNEDDEDFIGWFGEGEIVPGQSADLYLEFVVYLDDIDLCLIEMEAVESRPDDSCEACEWAFELTLGNVLTEVGDQCLEHDMDPATLEGSSVFVGYAEGELYWQKQGEWLVAGEAEYLPEDSGFFGWEYDLGLP